MALVALAVALATYPIVRRLTRRLEDLQAGVERWGQGDLGVRVEAKGQDEVGFLAQRFNHAASRIEALVQSRDALLASQKSLLANASHELRSPLARIRMGLELMGDGSCDAVAQRRPAIERNLQELDMLIEEILLASRLDSKEANVGTFEPVDLVGLAAEECARVQALLLDPPAQLSVPGVRKLLRRALRNLLENALKHSPHGTRIAVEVGVGPPTGVWVQVCDDGQRQPAGAAPGPAPRPADNLHLGHEILRRVADVHGGRFGPVAPGPTFTTCFRLDLPASPRRVAG